MEKFMDDNSSNYSDRLNDIMALLDSDFDQQQQLPRRLQLQEHPQQQQQHLQQLQIQNYLQQHQQQLLPRIVIVEQPAKAVRFRYKRECQSRKCASSIPGRNSNPENKTYPTIRVIDYVGEATVVISLVTKDSYDGKYRTHPHSLVGNGCIEKEGFYHVQKTITNNLEESFSNLGIQCVKRDEIKTSFKTKQEARIDPFKAGFLHEKKSIELNVVRLCFELYLPNEKGDFKFRLQPIVSDPIYDEKTLSSLRICRVEPCCASVAGSATVVLFCERVFPDNIEVRFLEKKNNEITWEGNAEFTTTDVHKKAAIALKTPKYNLKPGDKSVKVFIQLRRPSDGAVGEARPFEFIAIGADDPDYLKRKRTKYSNNQTTDSLYELQYHDENTVDAAHQDGITDESIDKILQR